MRRAREVVERVAGSGQHRLLRRRGGDLGDRQLIAVLGARGDDSLAHDDHSEGSRRHDDRQGDRGA